MYKFFKSSCYNTIALIVIIRVQYVVKRNHCDIQDKWAFCVLLQVKLPTRSEISWSPDMAFVAIGNDDG